MLPGHRVSPLMDNSSRGRAAALARKPPPRFPHFYPRSTEFSRSRDLISRYSLRINLRDTKLPRGRQPTISEADSRESTICARPAVRCRRQNAVPHSIPRVHVRFGSFVGSISGAVVASAWSVPHDHGSHQADSRESAIHATPTTLHHNASHYVTLRHTATTHCSSETPGCNTETPGCNLVARARALRSR